MRVQMSEGVTRDTKSCESTSWLRVRIKSVHAIKTNCHAASRMCNNDKHGLKSMYEMNKWFGSVRVQGLGLG